MGLVDLAELVAAGFREDRVGDAAIAVASLTPDEALALEAVEQACHAAGGQQEAVRQVHAPHAAVGRPGEHEQRLVGVERQAVIRLQLGAQVARDRRAGAYQAHEGLDLAGLCLGSRWWGHWLGAQATDT